MSGGSNDLLIEGAAAIATLAGGLRRGAAQHDAAVLSGGRVSVAVWNGRVLAVGRQAYVHRRLEAEGHSLGAFERIDAQGGLVTPGLVDAHTHLLFGGTREAEWQMRAAGAGYLEILAAGGGILSTVAATRAASDSALLADGRARLAQMLANGTTTAEAKSGYALNVDGELRLLALIDRLSREGPLELVPTFLGAHAVPAEFRDRPDGRGTDAYVAHVIGEQLPAVVRQGIARSCDVFCENGVFDATQSRLILEAAAAAGLAVRMHADELAPSGGAELAGELAGKLAGKQATAGLAGGPVQESATRRGCLSADHLAAPSDAGVAALARAADAGHPVVATLLPATSWFLGKHHFAPARRFIDAGIPVALATDLNPGTSPTLSLPLVMSIACLEMGLTPVEALVGVTVNAAQALGLDSDIGSIEPGKQADLVIWDVPTVEQLPYWLGGSPARTVIKRGRVVFERD